MTRPRREHGADECPEREWEVFVRDPVDSAILTIPLNSNFLPLATAFAERAAGALGLGRAEGLKLTLACEEVFGYLAAVAPPGEAVTITAEGRVYYLRLDFVFKAREVDLRLFNLAARISPDDEADLEQLGLLIASRTVERFLLTDQGHEGLLLSLFKERAYPPDEGHSAAAAPAEAELALRPAAPEDLAALARLLKAHHRLEVYPPSFAVPGKLIDMVASGEYSALVACDQQGRLGGAILWDRTAGRTVRCHGPYLFNRPGDSPAAEQLVEGCVSALAHSDAAGIIFMYPPPEMPGGYFELLGSLDFHAGDGGWLEMPCYYRQLQEDPGLVVWSHPGLDDFLKEQYQRLAFARDLNSSQGVEHRRGPHSVFSTSLDREHARAVLHPMWDGEDLAENLARHVKALNGEGVSNLFCHIDLAYTWQAALTGHLLEAGFTPRLILPFGGKGDVVIFQHRAE